MKAAYFERTGSPEVITYGELDKPKLQPGQALVKMSAVSVNPIDLYIRGGANFWELPNPYIIGCDLAGTVEEVRSGDSGLSDIKPGTRVWCTNQGLMGRQGTFAEYCAIDLPWLVRSPDCVDDSALAACALVGVTAHLGLFREARITAGESIFINGGSGGVGAMVVQMAKAAGAHVFTTCGSDDKVRACLQLGADAAVNYKTQDVANELKSFAPDGVNVYWETVREPDLDAIVACMAERGRIVLMAGRDARPPMPVGPFYVKQCSLHGFVMFKASADELKACGDDMNRWLESGELRPNIAKRLPLSAAAEAHQLQEENTLGKTGTLQGKIILQPEA